MIREGNTNVVIDTGPDFRAQMLREKVKQLDGIIFTHEHKDHVAGLDDVRAFNLSNKPIMPIYCTNQVYNRLAEEFNYAFDPKFRYPGIPKILTNLINDKPFSVGEINFTPIQVWHYKLPVLGFRVNNLTYITDANKIDDSEKEKIKGTEILILNALRKETHISHFTLSEALELIEEIKPKKAYLTHISHLMGLHDEVSNELPENVEIAYDGLKINLD